MPSLSVLFPIEPESEAITVDVRRPLPYEDFVREVAPVSVGEIWLSPADNMFKVKAAIREAAQCLGLELHIWDISGNVYFRTPGPKRGRVSRRASTH